MKYLCLIYDEEKAMAGMSKAEGDAFMGEYFAFTEGIKKSGHYVGGEALKPVHTATVGPNGKVSTTDGRSPDAGAAGGYYLIGEDLTTRSGRREDPLLPHRGPADMEFAQP
jgi:hypothetical protein